MYGTASGRDGADSFAPSAASPPSLLAARAPLDSWSDSPPTCAAVLACPAPEEGLFLALPEIGGQFLGFELVAELGRGTFGRVFLGRQPELAGRLVALKVSTEIVSESQKLAQLQHTHIVPVYSLHRAGPLQAVCMPYYGAATLADVLQDLHQRRELPDSGRSLVSTLEERRSRALAGLVTPSGASRSPCEASLNLRRLEGLTHVETVLWLGACLADGLAHAHERGIVHRDLKPANVLLTDDGHPMLLDFNLADDTKLAGQGGRVGGTLPYMSPEHLSAFAGLAVPFGPPGTRAVPDGRSDTYSLGVILFELLTGQNPFRRQPGSGDAGIPAMIEERLRQQPCAAASNPAVTPAADSILRRCLAPDPADRYQSAAHLREDIHRHLDNLPLKHARERSLAERLRKWARRNPRLASMSSVAILAGGMLLVLAFSFAARGQRLARLDAQAGHRAFQDDLRACRLALAGLLPDDPGRAEGADRARRALALAGELEGRLPLALRESLAEESGELLLLLAGACEPEEGLRLNRLGEGRFRVMPVAVLAQRAWFLERLGDHAGADALRAALRGREPVNSADRFLLAREYAGRGLHEEAARSLRRVVEDEPGHFAAWFLLGTCALETGSDAVPAFTVCAALRPDSALAWRHRGLALLRLGRHADAEEDLSRSLKTRSDPDVLVLRALAREGQGKRREALADLESGPASVRLLLARSRLRRALGDEAGARRDREAAVETKPIDEESCVARGTARLPADPEGALADFTRALELNPRSVPALQGRAHVLAERLGRSAPAIAALSRLLEMQPGNVPARAGRAVLLARLGKRAEARADLRLALRASAEGEIQYQAACVHALLDDRKEALARLALALSAGFGHALIDSDDDLSSLRGEEGFDSLRRAARTLSHAAKEAR